MGTLSIRSIARLLLVAFLAVSFGSCTAHAVDGLELSLHTAAPDVLVVYMTDDGKPAALARDPSKITASDWNVNGLVPKALYRFSRAVDELPKTKDGKYPVETGHWWYLVLAKPLEEGRTYELYGPYGSVSMVFHAETTWCESIKVNQAGYHPDSVVRYANFGVFMGSGGSRLFSVLPRYRVLDATGFEVLPLQGAEFRGNDTVVDTATVSSGEFVYRLDLSAVPPGGPYRVAVEGCGVSHPFMIERASIATIARTYARGLYHQRCSIALEPEYTEWDRPVCHVEAAFTRVPWSASGKIVVDPRTPLIPVLGGHHDAGDFDRRPQHTMVPIMLLGYFEAFPTHFIDGQYGIPESGNGLPDILDEALWAILLWEHLQITDARDRQYGAVMAGTETSGHPEYGKTDAASDTLVYGTWAVDADVTASAAGMMACAARLIASYDGFESKAVQLYQKATLAWDYLERTPGLNGLPLSENATAANLYASLQLALATPLFDSGNTELHERLQNLFRSLADYLLVQDGRWPQQYRPGNVYAALQTVHFSSLFLQDDPFDPSLAEQLASLVIHQASQGGYMGFDMERSVYPQGATKAYGWGAATAQGRYADPVAFAYRLATDDAQQSALFAILSQYGDYSLGLNPLGISYVTGLGSMQVASPLHLDSYIPKTEGKGNVPGILVFGPSEQRSGADYQQVVSDTLYPAWDDLPLQRRWADGWSLVNNNEFSIWETMIWNICLYGVLYDASKATQIAE